tara:strand:+ start:913 stop:1203 length:291 start_codon:yes stop_codon:yes gene_type:complete
MANVPDVSAAYRHHGKQTPEEFLATIRGQYIISQALNKAIDVMEAVEPEEMRELSNIADMKFLRDELFNMYVSSEVLANLHARSHLIKKELEEGEI